MFQWTTEIKIHKLYSSEVQKGAVVGDEKRASADLDAPTNGPEGSVHLSDPQKILDKRPTLSHIYSIKPLNFAFWIEIKVLMVLCRSLGTLIYTIVWSRVWPMAIISKLVNIIILLLRLFLIKFIIKIYPLFPTNLLEGILSTLGLESIDTVLK
jgi:hypothetical protein